ncbi:3-oxoacyl-ACP reductase [Roseivirga seohaensis subsp. aquiponti]|uniref:3-oxoacyl-ACP reductase n=1 Tax=Roseivirga seohaensis subsp. aquiponti TaxID=1566026 RepID=A0A0L8AQV8_9BACT|nr:SDR family NAD(P)-dependent oxidoreductase [Roseivirga seohaensis]KOF04557.1 3-oxoacyl-ACP reductase [Roseivirga seohaensis subsp. aquiponti]
MEISLKGKVILVTGGSRGIGRALSKQLSDAGAAVAVHYNSNEEQAQSILNELNPSCRLFQADLSNTSETINLFKQVIKEMNGLDVLINNAGVAISSDLVKADDDWLNDWQFTMNVNLQATGLLCKKSIEHFLENGGGRIINISSRAAFRGDTADYLAYAASKGGVVALTRSIARSYGKNEIKAFTIAPGFVRTDMAQDFMDQYGEGFALNDIALNQLTEPKDLAPLVTLMASGLMDHATGCTIDVNAASYVH